MSYTVEIAKTLATTLNKLVSLNRHQLAGQAANLDFWTEEVVHCLAVVDGYHSRFIAMKSAQTEFASRHRSIEFSVGAPDDGQSAKPPRPVPDSELKAARLALCDAFNRFIARSYNAQLIDRARLDRVAEAAGINISSKDLDY